MPKHTYSTGALIFAKVKGYPPWPARITGLGSRDRYKIFFYGTYETATLRGQDIWPYNSDNKAKFAGKNMKKQLYADGIDQIENTPEIAPIDGVDENGLNSTVEVESTPSKTATIASNAVSVLSKAAIPAAKSNPKSASAKVTNKRKASQASDEETAAKMVSSLVSVVSISPADGNTNNPSEKKTSISPNPKKFWDEKKVSTPAVADARVFKSPGNKESSENPDGDQRKKWVNAKDTQDLIVINLDKDRPKSLESIEARLEEKENLSADERAKLDKEKQLEKKKSKLRWLKIEQKIVVLDVAVKTALHMERPATDDCITALDEVYELALAPLMLKKQPSIVNTIRLLRNYVGPQDYANWTDKTKKEKVDKDIQVIKDKADQIFEKFKSCFAFQGDTTFWKAFEAEVNEFKERTAGLDESMVLSMISDPTMPLSNMGPSPSRILYKKK